MADDRSLSEAALGDGRFPVALTGFCLVLSGGFALMQSVSGHLLPHDSTAIGMDAAALTRAGNPHLLGFMFHDRVAYGGSLLAIGFGYMWLAAFPMSAREPWAWWSLLFSGAIGFLAFLTYLGQQYLDTWHGIATLFLLPVFVAGVWRSRHWRSDLKSIWRRAHQRENSFARAGRILLECHCSRPRLGRPYNRDFRRHYRVRTVRSEVHRIRRQYTPANLTHVDPGDLS